MSRFHIRVLAALLLAVSTLASPAQSVPTQAFDLVGPKVDVHVQRGGKTLPIAEVPNLLPGDRLWIHPDFPDSQSAHYVLIVAFLRGITNPPPSEWFTHVDTWTRTVREEGVFVVVPDEAQQALVFLAPATGGDVSTLMKAVRGRPGAFVRATQDLQQASWDRLRLDAYLDGVKQTALHQPLELKDRTARMARTLGIKVDKECFDKPTEQQAPCLVQHTDGLVLDDANAHSMVDQLATGSTMDLVNQIGSTPFGGGGAYGAYVGAMVDMARIFASMHTASFQYIPALALPVKDTMNLRLNMPPSFRAPKSVMVVALPPVGAAKVPVLLPTAPTEELCAQKPELTLSVEGAPLIFASSMARELVLHMEAADGPLDIPLKADPGAGGLILTQKPPALKPTVQTAVVRGKWGFDNWEGPHFRLHSSRPINWKLAATDQTALIIGREDTVHVEADQPGGLAGSQICVESVEKLNANGSANRLTWKSNKPETLEIVIPMKEAGETGAAHEPPSEVSPTSIILAVHQYGLQSPDTVTMKAYAEAASLDRLTLSAGDTTALLKGTRLDEVAQVELAGIHFAPNALSRIQDADQLLLKADGATNALEPNEPYTAHVALHDGRQLKAPVTVLPVRPQLKLRSKGTQFDASENPSPVHLGSADDLPVNGRLVFFLESKNAANFPRSQKVEVASTDESFHTLLTLADGGLMLEDAHTALGIVEPLARFGSSAFGPIQVRGVSSAGVTGDWIPLGTLVRLPGFKELRCPHSLAKPCLLSGTNLFLITEVAATLDAENPMVVPADFTGTQLSVPHGTNGVLYLKLKDDPDTVQTLTLPVETLPAAQVVELPAVAAPMEDMDNPPTAESSTLQQQMPSLPADTVSSAPASANPVPTDSAAATKTEPMGAVTTPPATPEKPTPAQSTPAQSTPAPSTPAIKGIPAQGITDTAPIADHTPLSTSAQPNKEQGIAPAKIQ